MDTTLRYRRLNGFIPSGEVRLWSLTPPSSIHGAGSADPVWTISSVRPPSAVAAGTVLSAPMPRCWQCRLIHTCSAAHAGVAWNTVGMARSISAARAETDSIDRADGSCRGSARRSRKSVAEAANESFAKPTGLELARGTASQNARRPSGMDSRRSRVAPTSSTHAGALARSTPATICSTTEAGSRSAVRPRRRPSPRSAWKSAWWCAFTRSFSFAGL